MDVVFGRASDEIARITCFPSYGTDYSSNKYDDVDDDDERRKNWPRTAQPHAAPLAAACRLPSTTALHRRMHFRAASTRRRLTTWRKMRFESFDSNTVGRRPEETDVRRLYRQRYGDCLGAASALYGITESDINLFATRPFAAKGFQTIAPY